MFALVLLTASPALLLLAPAARGSAVRMVDVPPTPPPLSRLATPTRPGFERLHPTGLRQIAVDTLEELREPTAAAVAHERKALLTKRERGLLYATAAAVASLTRLRVSMRTAIVIFFAARCGTAALARRPDPRVLITTREMALATRQAIALAAEAVQLAALTVAFSGCALSASLELVTRIAVLKASLALEASAATADTTRPTLRGPSNTTAARDGREQIDNVTAGATGARLRQRTGAWWARRKARNSTDLASDAPSFDGSVAVAIAPHAANASSVSAAAADRAKQPAAESSVTRGGVEAAADGVAVALPPHSAKLQQQTHLTLATLARSAAWTGGAHALLTAAALVWTAEALFVVCLGALQRLWLRLLWLAARTTEQGRRFRRYLPTAQQRAQAGMPGA